MSGRALTLLVGALLCAPAAAGTGGDDVGTGAVTTTVGLQSGVTQAEGAPAPVASPTAVRQRLLILELDAAGVSAATAKIVNGLVTQGLARSTSLEVITSGDLGALVDLEAQRAATGCDTTSCLAELAGAMGTRFVVFGTVGRLGEVTLVQLSLFDSEAAKPIAREEVRAKDESALLDAVPQAARSLVATVVAPGDPLLNHAPQQMAASETAEDDAISIGLIPLTLYLAGGGVAGASFIVGGLCTLAFVAATTALQSDNVAASLKNDLYQPLGIGAAVLGGTAMVAFGVGAAVGTAGFFVE